MLTVAAYPIDQCTDLELQNMSHDGPKLHKNLTISWSWIPNIVKGPVG